MKICDILICLLFFAAIDTVWGEDANLMKAPHPVLNYEQQNQSDSFIYKIYHNYISPVDGDRCSMLPGCSTYSRDAIQRYGTLKGLILTTDRLIRCGSDASQYKHKWIGQRQFCLDPVEIPPDLFEKRE